MKILRTPNHVQIERAVDERMRLFLVNACHPAVRFRMQRALSHRPHPPDVLWRVKRYFGGQGPTMKAIQVAVPVVAECEKYCPGLSRWMILTGYANEPLMIAAFAAWAENPVDYSNVASVERH
jgi:hypothetical protein